MSESPRLWEGATGLRLFIDRFMYQFLSRLMLGTGFLIKTVHIIALFITLQRNKMMLRNPNPVQLLIILTFMFRFIVDNDLIKSPLYYLNKGQMFVITNLSKMLSYSGAERGFICVKVWGVLC